MGRAQLTLSAVVVLAAAVVRYGLPMIETLLQASPLHGAPQVQSPVPHWAVLLTVVLILWNVIGGAVLVIDRLLQRFEEKRTR